MKRRKNKKTSNLPLFESDSDENFAFIAGYTSGGAPYGITWEEWEANDQSKCAAGSRTIRTGQRDSGSETSNFSAGQFAAAFRNFSTHYQKRKKQKVADPLKVPKALQRIYESVSSIIDDFCQEHLNREYSLVSRKLAATLCRKRPSPLLMGKYEIWACACVYVIGNVNFLHDKTQSPHMPLGQICNLLGVSKSSASVKAKSIQQLMNITQLDPRWTLPSKLADNPLNWLLEVDGLMIDVRNAPLALQEEAFRQGMIPFVPGER